MKKFPVLVFSAILATLVVAGSGHTSSYSGWWLNNLQQIEYGLWGFEDGNKRLPTDILDAQAKPILSWRVRILPYVEADNLYKKFNLKEPWDSPNNRGLLSRWCGSRRKCGREIFRQILLVFRAPRTPVTSLFRRSKH